MLKGRRCSGRLQAQFAGAGLRYWITPVVEIGEIT